MQRFNRAALLVALIAIGSGALLTGQIGAVAAAHRIAGLLAAALCAAAVFKTAGPRRRAGIAAVVAGAFGCLNLGGAVAHAIAAPVFLACLAAVAIQPEPAVCERTLRKAILASPGLVLIQIALGALYRHKVLGVLPHMAGAMLAAGLLLVLAVMALQRYPDPSALRTASTAVLAIVLTQVSLGIAAFVMRLLDFDASPAFTAVATAHVTVGSVTLAASVLMGTATAGEARSTRSTGPLP